MIQVEKLNKTYDRHRLNANHVLKDVTFELPETGFVCILGPSGCGKTSLLNAVGGLDKFDRGVIKTDTVRVSRYGTRRYEAERNKNFGYIFQNYYLLPEHSVAYNVYLGMHSLKLSHLEKLRRIRQALAAVDMSRYIRRKVGELSGGQQQRVAIARALARRPRVIFADEPTGNLDEANTMNICTLLRQISKTSLVIMVTHEERIAEFFADRIIRMDNGRIVEDAESWSRDGISLGDEKELYAGDYREDRFQADQVSLRILQQEGAAPVDVTVMALKDRIVIKLLDNRAVTCGAPGELPVLKEGKRPTMTREVMDNEEQEHAELISGEPALQARAGRGIGFGMMFREAKSLSRTRGGKRIGTRIFLILLTILTVWTACDYLTVSSVNPREFITSHSKILEVRLKRGAGASGQVGLLDLYAEYMDFVADSRQDFDFLPPPSSSVTYNVKLFPQMRSIKSYLTDFNYIHLDRLDADTLIYGSMPNGPGQVVVDTWVLEKMVEEDSITKNAITSVEFFLGQTLDFDRAGVSVTVTGICDSGEPALYMCESDLLSIMSLKKPALISLSDFKQAHPGQYNDVNLVDGECLINVNAMGTSYNDLIGLEYGYNGSFIWTIKDTVETEDRAGVVVSDDQMWEFIRSLCQAHIYLYCEDKQAMLEHLTEKIPDHLADALIIDIYDEHTDATEAYMEASRMKVNARTIVTATVILLSLVMLYLLCRAQVQERIGMLAVYRLLGIPKRKLAWIFAMESVITSLRTALPATLAVWVIVTLIGQIEALKLGLVLPIQIALAVFGGILVYHLVVSVLPLRRLLRLPPAQLAAKYDF